MSLPSLRNLTQAGGRMDPELTKEYAAYCERNGSRFITMYGQTEATARISILDPNYISSKSPSVGQSIPGGRIEIHSPEGTKINQPNTPGEIIYFGKNVSLGYCQERIDLSKGNDNKFVLKTGDIGYLDSDNFLFITGRKSRFLKYFGNRLSLDDIENILISKFENVACIEVDDNLIIYTQVVLDKIEIRKILFEFLNFKIDFTLKNIKIIPKTESGKIDYYSLRLDYTKVGTF
jgi:acyl-coenzyme A synthetase/AMP-(fatty) acid ligase